VTDCCNPIELTRQEWEDVAVNNNCRFVNIEVVCSNKTEHKKRAEQRNAEVANMKLPVWDDIENREYHEWHKSRIVIDTAGKTIKQCQTELKEKVADNLSQKEDGRATATDIALASGLANNTLTSMIKKLVDQGLVTIEQSDQDKRKKFVVLTELGWAQKEIGDRVSQELGEIFYQGFSDNEIQEFEEYQERIINNLKKKENVE